MVVLAARECRPLTGIVRLKYGLASIKRSLGEKGMSSVYPDVDQDGLYEYSVVFTDRSLNHMSQQFQAVMRNISINLKSVYNADAVAVVPGGGTYGMEAIARQFAHQHSCLVIRNGFFSYRWSQIFEMGNIPSSCTVLKAAPVASGSAQPFAPPAIAEVVAEILSSKPSLVFAAHVETASGILLPDDYLVQVSKAVRSYGGMLVLDCVASGAMWVDMKACGVDILLSAPQKGWSGQPCAALVMLSATALERIGDTVSSSFACDLKKWLNIMQAYENGGHAYHATMPTDGLVRFNEMLNETITRGLEPAREAQLELGRRVRKLLADAGYISVAAEGFGAPGVVVAYTDDSGISGCSKFIAQGLQTAAGVPLMCDEPADFQTFRLGLFGLDKLADIDTTVQRLEAALKCV
jgi:aspartate aminotransferase-like enzyme